MISGYNNLSTFSGYLAMGRPHRQLVLILTEVVPPLTTLFLHLRFIMTTLNTLFYKPTHINKIDTDYNDYAVLQGYTLKYIYY